VGGFSLLEVLITLMVLLIIFVALIEFMTDVGRVWKATANDPYAEAEDAFSVLARNLSTATLEPYSDYTDATGNFRTNAAPAFVPDHPARRSDLAFVCGPGGELLSSGRSVTGSAIFFLAPHGYTRTYAHEGMERLLNALGYFVEFGDDPGPAFFSTGHSWRWRLKQIVQPAESLHVFEPVSSAAWIQQVAPSGFAAPVLAENIATLLVLPERTAHDEGTPLSSDFRYDSRDAAQPLTRNQLPPRLRLVLVAIDGDSARRLALHYGSQPPPLVPEGLFREAALLDSDLATLDNALNAQKTGHRIFDRHIALTSSAWSETTSP